MWVPRIHKPFVNLWSLFVKKVTDSDNINQPLNLTLQGKKAKNIKSEELGDTRGDARGQAIKALAA